MNISKSIDRIGFVTVSLLVFVGIIIRAYIDTMEPLIAKMFFRDTHVDLFSYVKAQYLIWLVVIGAVLMITSLFEKPERLKSVNSKYNLALFAMIGLVIISTLTSAYKSIAVWGFVDRYEGAVVWGAYLLIPVLLVYFANSIDRIKSVLNLFTISVTFMCVVGVLQYVGYDILETNWIRYFIYPLNELERFGAMTIETTSIYSTLYNPNFVGGLVAIAFPVFMYNFTTSANKQILVIRGVQLVLLIITLVGSRSNAGYLAVGVTSVVYIALMLIKNLVDKKRVLIMVSLIVLTIVSLLLIDKGFKYELGYADPVTSGSVTSPVVKARQIVDIIKSNQRVDIVTDRDQVSIVNNEGNIRLLDKNGQDLPVVQIENGNAYLPRDDEYKGYIFKFFFDRNLMEIVVDGRQVPILMSKSDIDVYGLDGKPITVSHAESFGFKGYENMASGRGYIWSRSLPLIKDTLLIGRGADTFPLYFPQYDVDKLLIVDNLFLVVDKPHNTFIQLSISFGLLFVVVYLGIMLVTILKLMSSTLRRKDSLALVLCTSLIAFNITSMLNDSNVNVNPYLWILLGLSLAYLSTTQIQSQVKVSK